MFSHDAAHMVMNFMGASDIYIECHFVCKVFFLKGDRNPNIKYVLSERAL